ncbi:MAG: Cupin domain protein [Candidatus Sulfotelmatobacter sp.]|nr:Cupin domain protein [Candidatus Sulfotelmatobacter sp.]
MKFPILFCLATTLLTAQATAPEVEITSEPHHHLVFENKSVRVFNVEVPPNTETLTHWHRHDYISTSIGPGEIANTVKDKPLINVKLQDGETRFVSATFAHFVRDIGAQPFRNVTVEILEDESLRNSTPKWDATKDTKDQDRRLADVTNGTKKVLFVKDGIRVSQTELQPGAVIPTHHHTSPHLLIAVSDLDLRSDVEGQAPTAEHFKSGDSKWIPGGYTHTLTNTSTKPAKYVTLEFP